MNPKVLITTPINVVKSYILYEWLEHIRELDYDNYDIFLVDNSLDTSFSKKIRDLGFDCVHEPPSGREARHYMASSNERCRVKFLSSDYAFFLSLECDIFPPKDIIKRLLARDKDVVGTTFWTHQGHETQLQLLTIYEYHTDVINHKKEYKVRPLTFEEALLFIDGTCKPIFANGIGCTLIKRWVLENIPFRIDPIDTGFADSFFHQDLWESGIPNFVDTSIIPRHQNSSWSAIADDSGHKKMALNKGHLTIR